MSNLFSHIFQIKALVNSNRFVHLEVVTTRTWGVLCLKFVAISFLLLQCTVPNQGKLSRVMGVDR